MKQLEMHASFGPQLRMRRGTLFYVHGNHLWIVRLAVPHVQLIEVLSLGHGDIVCPSFKHEDGYRDL